VRKGRFGLFYHNFIVGLRPNNPIEIVGPVTLDWDTKLMMFDVGISYELGRWKLGRGSNAAEFMLEPYLEARIINFPISLRVAGNKINEDLNSQVPVVGMKAFIDLTKQWNLEFIGDYGGFGVDDNHQTWQGAAYLGYRFQGLTLDWNLQVGYRAMQIFELRQDITDLSLNLRGAQITLGVEF
jgi:hypothetical protein